LCTIYECYGAQLLVGVLLCTIPGRSANCAQLLVGMLILHNYW